MFQINLNSFALQVGVLRSIWVSSLYQLSSFKCILYLGCKINVSRIVLVGTRYYLVGSQVLVVQVPRGGRWGGSCLVLRTQVIGIIVLSSTMVLGTMILVRVVVLTQIFWSGVITIRLKTNHNWICFALTLMKLLLKKEKEVIQKIPHNNSCLNIFSSQLGRSKVEFRMMKSL